MAYPKDYRYEPYSDILDVVQVTEYHLIPATSPYLVRLNEVPQKSSPSTMVVRAVSSFGEGSPVYGNTYTEVSATPSSGQFYPDYYTGADEDENWNTGTLLFNSANAGQLLEVTYYATGALASLKSNHYPDWWTDRGDGSDGVFAPTANVTLGSGEYNYKAVYIPIGVTVTVTKSVLIKCQGAFVNFGTINADGQGASGGTWHMVYGSDDDADYWVADAGNSGYGLGGAGGAGGSIAGGWGITRVFGAAGGSVALIAYPKTLSDYLNSYGAGGGGSVTSSGRGTGRGGAGGGAVCVITNQFTNSGVISANGVRGTVGYDGNYAVGGAGGGGSVLVVCEKINALGTITANGGASQTYSANGTVTGAAGANGTTKVIEVGAR